MSVSPKSSSSPLMSPLPGSSASIVGEPSSTPTDLVSNTPSSVEPVSSPSGTPSPATPSPSTSTVPLGINIDGLSDGSRAWVYCDAMKTARTWGSAAKPEDGKSPAVDANGWPLGDFGTYVFTNQPDSIHGTYQLSFTGKAVVKAVASNASLGVMTYDPTKNSSTLSITVNGNQLALVFASVSPGISKIRLLRPGCDDTSEFYNPLISALKPFSVIRFMDLLATNNNPVVHWADRNKPTDAHYTNQKGIPWEDAIDLANDTSKDMWINIPAMADDDYVNQLAALLKARLKPGIKIYLEISNESWNSIFSQTSWIFNEAKAEVAAGDTKLNDAGTDTNQTYWQWKWIGKRLLGVSTVFKTVLGGDRIRPVLSMQIANPTTFLKPLQYIAKYYGDPKTQIYGIAGAPYFSTKERDDVNGTRVLLLNGLTNSVESQVLLWQAGKPWDGKSSGYTFGQLAAYFGLRKLSYESGPDTHGSAIIAIKSELQQSPDMGALVKRYYSLWYGCGGDLINYFSLASPQDNVSGSWGAYSDLSVLSGEG